MAEQSINQSVNFQLLFQVYGVKEYAILVIHIMISTLPIVVDVHVDACAVHSNAAAIV